MTQPLRVLLIDDNKSDRALVIRELTRAFDQIDITEIISSGEFNRAVRAGGFDAVITDFQLRWTTGLEILESVKQHYPACPVIMFTNTGTEEVAVEAMKMGLDDYIIKEPNRYIRVPASLRVVMERVESRRRTALLEIRLQGLLNQVKVGIFRSTSDGTLLETNPAFLKLLRVESLAQANELALLDTRGCYDRLTEMPPPQQLEQEMHLQRRDGSKFWAFFTATLNTVEGVAVVDGLLEDISDRKETEISLQQINATLEERVRERTAELESANQDLEEFAFSASHDLRAPLRAIQGFAQILLEDIGNSLAPENLECLQRIAINAQQLDTLITDLLAYSRLSQSDITLEPVSLSLALADVLTQLQPELQEQQAQVEVAEGLPMVQANRLILIQALTNLLSNAIKFVPNDAQPRVRIWAEQQEQRTLLWIEDNGIGIPPDKQQQIFRPFSRLHGEEEYPGTGIGLAIARKGIERMDGRVGIKSEVGQGSRFWVELPAVRESR